MSTTAKKFSDDAQQIFFAAIEQAITYSKEHGIEQDVMRAAAIEVGEFLLTFGGDPQPSPPPPDLGIFRGDELQLRFPFDQRGNHR